MSFAIISSDFKIFHCLKNRQLLINETFVQMIKKWNLIGFNYLQYKSTTTFEELEDFQSRAAVWDSIFKYLDDPTHFTLHEKCLIVLRILRYTFSQLLLFTQNFKQKIFQSRQDRSGSSDDQEKVQCDLTKCKPDQNS